jgi:CHAT domain-containing protein
VVAATRAVVDQPTQGLIASFYQRWQPGTDPAEALRQAQLAWRAGHPRDDWSSFRVFVP